MSHRIKLESKNYVKNHGHFAVVWTFFKFVRLIFHFITMYLFVILYSDIYVFKNWMKLFPKNYSIKDNNKFIFFYIWIRLSSSRMLPELLRHREKKGSKNGNKRLISFPSLVSFMLRQLVYSGVSLLFGNFQ